MRTSKSKTPKTSKTNEAPQKKQNQKYHENFYPSDKNPRYMRLRSGEWGLRIPFAQVESGDTVVVTLRDGSKKKEIVGKIIFTDGKSITIAGIGT